MRQKNYANGRGESKRMTNGWLTLYWFVLRFEPLALCPCLP
jgi:hypothetical protein